MDYLRRIIFLFMVFVFGGVGNAQTPDAVIDVSTPLFSPLKVQTVYLTMKPEDWQKLKDNVYLDDYYEARFEWEGQAVERVGIRSRGSSSRNAKKPAIKVDFGQYVSGQKFLKQKALVLLNMVQEEPMLRDYLSMQLFRRMGVAAPRDAYLKLMINDEYQGLYLMTEDLDTPFLARNFFNNVGWLYEFKLTETAFLFQDLGDDPNVYVPVPFELKTNKKTPNTGDLITLIQTVNKTTPQNFIAEVSPWLDIRKALRQLAVEIYLGEIDGLMGVNGMSNFYLYQPGQGSPQFVFVPWDKSAALNFYDYGIWLRFEDNILFGKMMQVPELRASLLEQLREVQQTAGGKGGWLEQTAFRALDQFRDLAHYDTNKPFTNEQFDQGVETILFNIRARYDHVDQQLRVEGY